MQWVLWQYKAEQHIAVVLLPTFPHTSELYSKCGLLPSLQHLIFNYTRPPAQRSPPPPLQSHSQTRCSGWETKACSGRPPLGPFLVRHG